MAEEPKKKSPINFGRILIALFLFFVVYAIYAVSSKQLKSSLALFDGTAFVMACGLAFGNYVVRFLKWEYYLAQLGIRGVKKVDSFLTFLSGFILTVSPGKVGEVFKSLVLEETYGVPIPKTAPIVVAERITDLIGIITLIILGSLGFHGGLAIAGLGACLVAALLVVISSRPLSMRIIGLIARLPGPFRKIGPKLELAYESLTILVAPKNLLLPTLLSIGAWSLECLALWVILRGFGEHLSVPLCFFFYATSTLAGALVAIVPGGLGITEEGLREQLIDIGKVSSGVAVGAMMLVRIATLWFAVAVGFVALGLLKLRYPNLLKAR
ncbi:lysylphosphatidylglycerol synthase transmembrane domain-containing protein [soil metagenome]